MFAPGPDRDMIEVKNGLNKGDVAATAGVYHLEEGMKVRQLQ